jgi:predicted RNase H-like nuclease
MHRLLIGFDSAWTRTNSGALVGVLQNETGTLTELGDPTVANYQQAEEMILRWQADHNPISTLILLDQPTIVKNATSQRPVESIVDSSVIRRRGKMQPANTAREEMFGRDAPVGTFLKLFGGPANPLVPRSYTQVLETYPVLALISLDWTLPDTQPRGRLPKYNPARRKKFSILDWKHVCKCAAAALAERRLIGIAGWIESAALIPAPRKIDQDRVHACLCLLVALHLNEQKKSLMIGNMQSGYIVVPYLAELHTELSERCGKIDLAPADWVREFTLSI